MSAQESVEEKHQAICFVSSTAPDAEAARLKLIDRYGDIPFEEADVIVALGGDGTMLQTLHRTMSAPKPVYGMNRGSLGFLMNDFSERGLRARLAVAQPSIIHPLLMRTRDVHDQEMTARAINEVSLWRQKYQAAKIEILVDDRVRVAFEILESEKRPVAAAADHIEIRDVLRVDVETDYATSLILLHDAGHPFDERTLREQFGV